MTRPTFRQSRALVFLTAVALWGFGLSFDTQAQWVNFVDETATRLSVASDLGANDPEEKDYAVGDVDRDGDLDVVVVRKVPLTNFGGKVNLLLLNENGVLTDRTQLYVTDTNVPGDFGFDTETNDRDVQLVDIDNDGWLDIVVAATMSDGLSQVLGHPRIYRNRGLDHSGLNWQGFIFDVNRIPVMDSYTGQSGFNPRFCSVSAGDLTGDGRVELYFGDYDNGAEGTPQPAGADFNDRLLLNSGGGVFSDATGSRFLGQISIPGSGDDPFVVSRFGAANYIADMNGDGALDIVKQTSLQAPFFVGIAYNDPDNLGYFNSYEVVIQDSPYFVSVGDLNNDDRLDLVITDDGADRYLINTATGGDGRADWSPLQGFSFNGPGASDPGFGGNSYITDLDNDGWNDVIITDVDVDSFGCGRRTNIYHNQGGTPGAIPTLLEEAQGTNCGGGSTTCSVASIPNNKLVGVHDIAIIDINGDGWDDMVVGRCSGTEVYMNVPQLGLLIQAVHAPTTVQPDQTFDITVDITSFGGASIEPGSEKLFVSIDGGSYMQSSLTHVGGSIYQGTLPAAPCGSTIDYYFYAETTLGAPFTDPSDAPLSAHRTLSAIGIAKTFEDNIEGDVSGWTVVNDPSLSTGAWEQADPIGTIHSSGQQAAPDDDSDDGAGNIQAFVTEQGLAGGSSGAADVDGGPTDLISPPLSLAGSDGVISYSVWHFSNGADVFEVAVTNNGSDWTTVETLDGSHNAWEEHSFTVSEFVTPTADVQVRFRAHDSDSGSIVEGGVDQFYLEQPVCNATGAGAIEGAPLTVTLQPTGEITLAWGSSCNVADSDYEVYGGVIGDWYSHSPVVCSTSGTPAATFPPRIGGAYYLVVPTNGSVEGSYGVDSSGSQRPQGAGACRTQMFDSCE